MLLAAIGEFSWNAGTLAIVFGCSIPIVAIIANAWYRVERTKSADILKRKMLERGMSVEEIERVLKAGVPEEG